MCFSFVPKLVTLNDLERRSSRYFALFQYFNEIGIFGDNYITMYEVRLILSATQKCSPKDVFLAIYEPW